MLFLRQINSKAIQLICHALEDGSVPITRAVYEAALKEVRYVTVQHITSITLQQFWFEFKSTQDHTRSILSLYHSEDMIKIYCGNV